ncbi:MAG: SIS domain-containing protein [Acidimicrobiales bacterium]|nr:SIS domain-containing protein [Acidimicrobiales bacterium]
MCGIIGVVRKRDDRTPLDPADVLARLSMAADLLDAASVDLDVGSLETAAQTAQHLDADLRSLPGVRALVDDPKVLADVAALTNRFRVSVAAIDSAVDTGRLVFDASTETLNRVLVDLKDAAWALERDRVRNAAAIAALAPANPTIEQVAGFWSIQVALSALDRLEVRGRDSAGIEVVVENHGLGPDELEAHSELSVRLGDAVYRSGAVRADERIAVFVYKAAAEIGELGDNTAALRAAIDADELLTRAMSRPGAHTTVLGHTRWASIGIISEANAHPLDSCELGKLDGPLVTSVLNGDVDNFADLKAHHRLEIAPEITTDAKVIPTLVARGLERGDDALEAFRSSVASFEGSVAIATHIVDDPSCLYLALRGSGQALYVGLADHAYVVASEPYGVVEEAGTYLRLDGETPADPDNPVGSRGQIVRVESSGAGTTGGLTRISYSGEHLRVAEAELVRPEITTRDIDLGDAPHFFLKEVGEAPESFRKTLRGRIVEADGLLEERLDEGAFPSLIADRLGSGQITHIISIGQGTAAVAGESLGAFLSNLARGSIKVESRLATELSGFGLQPDMSNTLVVAVSQSGTTTDTNRTVDLVRGRGAAVISIVNRRGSDLTDRSDGVLYTSDGRDVEMSVASTKAFYAQIAAGALLACAIARAVNPDSAPRQEISELLSAIRSLPEAMAEVVAERSRIGEIARRHSTSKRYWAVVGNGINATAARELRIKLSELCYKAIAFDSTEDKKHIDLSSEPMIIVCAAGLVGSTADDVAKEVAIFRAHKATPIVLASGDTTRFSAAVDLISLPAVHPLVDFVLATVAGHLFGYESALAIDALARPFRECRSIIEGAVDEGWEAGKSDEVVAALTQPTSRFFDGIRTNQYDGNLEASTAVRLSTLLRYASGLIPLDRFQVDFGKVGTPAVVIEDLMRALTLATDELTRPVDAIKHQAKTVTVGISRSDETLLESALVREVLAAGTPRDRLSYRALRTLSALDPAVLEVVGYTRYRIDGDVEGDALVQVIDRGGISLNIPTRTESLPTLRGTKHRAAFEREVTVSKGRSDNRTIVLIPEVKDTQPTGLTLLHVKMPERLNAETMRAVMQGYRGRYAALKDAVTETEPSFRDDLLATVDVIDLLSEPVYVLAKHWTS